MNNLIAGRYSPIQKLGYGRFGSVYLAFDINTQKQVALKFLNAEVPDAEGRFAREARLLQELKSPHVVEILDFNPSHAPPYLVMEFCEYGSLQSWVGAGRPWQDVALALSSTLIGLSAVHDVGGFHRDLKPANILVARHPTEVGKGIIKVADFGLARVPDTGKPPMTRSPGGTEGYMAPEIRQGAPYTVAADIYSLGVVGVELLTGQRAATAQPSTAVPVDFTRLLRAMLAAAAGERPSPRQVARTLQLLLSSAQQTVQAPPPPQPAPHSSIGAGTFLLGGLLVVGVIAALASLAGDKD